MLAYLVDTEGEGRGRIEESFGIVVEFTMIICILRITFTIRYFYLFLNITLLVNKCKSFLDTSPFCLLKSPNGLFQIKYQISSFVSQVWQRMVSGSSGKGGETGRRRVGKFFFSL